MKLKWPSVTFWGFVLLLTLLITIFIMPVFSLEIQQTLTRISYTVLFFSACLSLDRKHMWLLYFSLVAFGMEWVAGILDMPVMLNISRSINIFFFITVVILLIRQVAASKEVNSKVILGSVTGYLLLGLIFSIFVAIIMQADPGAFNVTHNIAGDAGKAVTHLGDSIYFTFVSMATLGYGDMLPLKPYTRSLAIFITVSGQLYIAIIIALLVGKFSTKST